MDTFTVPTQQLNQFVNITDQVRESLQRAVACRWLRRHLLPAHDRVDHYQRELRPRRGP